METDRSGDGEAQRKIATLERALQAQADTHQRMAEEAFEAKRAAYHQALHNQRSQWTDRKLSRKVPPKAEGQYLDIDRAQVRCHCITVSSITNAVFWLVLYGCV